MNIKECIDRVDSVKPNSYSEEDKVRWLSYLDATIFNDIVKTHEPECKDTPTEFTGYDADHMNVKLLAAPPYDELYVAYLKMRIDEENGETARYNNSAMAYNAYYADFAKWYNRTHMPLGVRYVDYFGGGNDYAISVLK
ncbi:hypothetical protein [Waltera intestinalis]|uniref:Uncharacterized protein n=1 Tax=Waltera intestinalis TaxID=2606635 RepID=A0A6L5YHX9_9FIRM|nr:hypothetical protein [Waltera intestinalis]MST57287.1 hypothetical protein [Waltera intestinalis]